MNWQSNVSIVQDEVLQSMQQKLDDLLGEMHSLQQQYVKCDSFISTQSEKVELVSSKKLMDEEGTRCCVCSQPVTAATPYKTKVYVYKEYGPRVAFVSLIFSYAGQMCRISVEWMMQRAM